HQPRLRVPATDLVIVPRGDVHPPVGGELGRGGVVQGDDVARCAFTHAVALRGGAVARVVRADDGLDDAVAVDATHPLVVPVGDDVRVGTRLPGDVHREVQV